MTHALDLLAECVDVLEAAIHGREAHVRHFIEVMQLFHRELADQTRRHLALAERAQLVTDMHDRGVERLARTGRFSSAFSMLLRSFCSSNGSRLASLFTMRGITSSAVSNVVKRSPHFRHSRRRRICWPSPASRESMTFVSS